MSADRRMGVSASGEKERDVPAGRFVGVRGEERLLFDAALMTSDIKKERTPH